MTISVESVKTIVSVSLGLVFVTSFATKLKERSAFEAVIFLLSGPLRSFYKQLSVFMLAIEAFAGICLCCGFMPRATAALTAALMILFDWVLLTIRVGHPGMDCGCFGAGRGHGVTGWQLARNALMTFGSIALLVATATSPSPRSHASNRQYGVAFGVAAILLAMPYLDTLYRWIDTDHA